MLTIQNHETGQVEPIVRSVTHQHPAWVLEQIGVSSEAELQAWLDGISESDYLGQDRDEAGIGAEE